MRKRSLGPLMVAMGGLFLTGCPTQPDRGSISYQEQIVFDAVTSVMSKQHRIFLTQLKKDSEAEKEFTDPNIFEDLVRSLSANQIKSWTLMEASSEKENEEEVPLNSETARVTETWSSAVDIFLTTEGDASPKRFARVLLEGKKSYNRLTPAAQAERRARHESFAICNGEYFYRVSKWKITQFIYD